MVTYLVIVIQKIHKNSVWVSSYWNFLKQRNIQMVQIDEGIKERRDKKTRANWAIIYKKCQNVKRMKASNSNFQWCFPDFFQTLNVKFQEEFRYFLKDGYNMGLREWIEQRWEKWQHCKMGWKGFWRNIPIFMHSAVSREIILILYFSCLIFS